MRLMVNELGQLEVEGTENVVSGTLEIKLTCEKNWEKSIGNQKK